METQPPFAYEPPGLFSDPTIWMIYGFTAVILVVVLFFATRMQRNYQSAMERQAVALERIATLLEKRA